MSWSLLVGHPGDADTFPLRPDHALSFVRLAGEQQSPLGLHPGADPAGESAERNAGAVLGAYRSARSLVRMEASAERSARGAEQLPGSELYSRCAKALLAVGGEPAAGLDRVLGLTAELIPLRHPLDLERDADGQL